MTDDAALFGEDGSIPHLHDNVRHPDYETSDKGARLWPGRRTSQRYQLLLRFELAGEGGLSNSEAARAAGIHRGSPWKRCDELRTDGLIEWALDAQGEPVHRPNPDFLPDEVQQRVSVITAAGLQALAATS